MKKSKNLSAEELYDLFKPTKFNKLGKEGNEKPIELKQSEDLRSTIDIVVNETD